MNPLARLSQFNARTTAALADWKAQQGSGLAWPKADQIALYCVAAVLALMLCAYALPESEATVYLRTQIALWGNLALFASAGILAVCTMIYNGGKGLKIEFGPAPEAELPEGETRPQLPTQSPYLTKFEITAVENYTAQKLSVETAAAVKSGITSGLSYAEIAREMGISEAYVRRYAGVLSRATIDLDVAAPIEE